MCGRVEKELVMHSTSPVRKVKKGEGCSLCNEEEKGLVR
jgi:hypothetical protein